MEHPMLSDGSIPSLLDGAVGTSPLSETVSEARRRAASMRRPVLLRVHTRLPDARLSVLLAAADEAGMGWFCWRDPGAGPHSPLDMVAIDSAGEMDADAERIARGGDCFVSREQVIDVPLAPAADVEPDRPLRVGGFAFGSSLPRGEGPWAQWPWRHLPASAILVTRSGAGDPHLTVCATVTARTTAAEVLRSIRRSLGLVLSTTAPQEPTTDDITPPPSAVPSHPEERAAWDERVERALGEIRAGSLKKVVLARQHRFDAPGRAIYDPIATLRALADAHPTCFVFGVGRPDGRCFVGASPELFLRVRNGIVETVAMAGTAPRGEDAAADDAFARGLQESVKEREEHAFVVEAIRTALLPLTVELDVPATPTIRRLTHLQHMATPIRGQLRPGVSILDVAAALHPTPAVGGVPRREALEWLQANEGLERGWYAAPVGWVGPDGDGVLAVGIRSALLDARSAWAFAGAGLVDGSTAEGEWQETSLKLRAVARCLRARG